jgi:arginine decarboxylase
VDVKDVKEVLEVHPFTREPYYLAILLVGAYQEAMGNFHNLLGTLNEAHILIDEEGGFHVQKIVPGHRLEDVLALARYDRTFLLESFRRTLAQAVKRGHVSDQEEAELYERYHTYAQKYTYLE